MRTFARVITSLQEETEAIGRYEQRISLEANDEARRIMEHAQREEFLHFAMDLEFLLRRKEKWRLALQKILFKDGDIVGLAEQPKTRSKTKTLTAGESAADFPLLPSIHDVEARCRSVGGGPRLRDVGPRKRSGRE
jgi:uncharacterized protein